MAASRWLDVAGLDCSIVAPGVSARSPEANAPVPRFSCAIRAIRARGWHRILAAAGTGLSGHSITRKCPGPCRRYSGGAQAPSA